MIIKVNRKSFLSSVANAALLITGRPALPFLNNISICFSGNSFRIESTNLESFYIEECEVEFSEDQSTLRFMVNPKDILNVIRGFTDEYIDIEYFPDIKELQIAENMKSRYTFKTGTSENYPEMKNPDSMQIIHRFPGQDFNSLFERVITFASGDPSKRPMQGIQLISNPAGDTETNFRLVTTDGHVLKAITFKEEMSDTPGVDCVLTVETIKFFLNIAGKNTAGDFIQLSISEKNFRLDYVTKEGKKKKAILGQLITEPFPNWERLVIKHMNETGILPKGFQVEKKAIMGSISRLRSVANSTTCLGRIKVGSDFIYIEAKDEFASKRGHEKIPLIWSSFKETEMIEIGLNLTKLENVLKHISFSKENPSEIFFFNIDTPSSCINIIGSDFASNTDGLISEPDFALIMPIMLNNY